MTEESNALGELSHSDSQSLLGLLVGDRLGGGSYRDVFALDKSRVVKIENDDSFSDREFCNVMEHSAWYYAKKIPELSEWLAPVLAMSKCSRFLIMARTRPIKKLPELVPEFLADCHYDNFGLYKGRVVCHDYAFNNFVKLAGRKVRLVKPSRDM